METGHTKPRWESEFEAWLEREPNDAVDGNCRALVLSFEPNDDNKRSEISSLDDLKIFLNDPTSFWGKGERGRGRERERERGKLERGKLERKTGGSGSKTKEKARREKRESENEKKRKGKKELIVIENMSAAWVKELLSQRSAPSHVFALHFAMPDGPGRVRVPLGQDLRRHFVLPYDQHHAIKLATKERPKEGELIIRLVLFTLLSATSLTIS